MGGGVELLLQRLDVGQRLPQLVVRLLPGEVGWGGEGVQGNGPGLTPLQSRKGHKGP